MSARGFQKTPELHQPVVGILEELGKVLPFTLEESALFKGQPRLLGKSENGMAVLEVIGNPQSPIQVSLAVTSPNDAPIALVQNSTLLMQLISLLIPEWKTSNHWLNQAIEKSIEQKKTIKKNTFGKQVSIVAPQSTGLVILTITATS